jgi:hypothetical protein
VLLTKLRVVYAGGDPSKYLFPDEALTAFMQHCAGRIGDAYFRTPRNTIKEFVNLLAVLEQNPGASWTDVISGVQLSVESNPDLEPLPYDEHVMAAVAAAPSSATTPPSPAHALGVNHEGDDDLRSFRL